MIKVTHTHDEIKRWAQVHHGTPELIDHTEAQADAVGIRINFPGNADDLLFSEASPPIETTWEEFFRIFDERGLALEYNDTKKIKEPGFAYRFLNRKE